MSIIDIIPIEQHPMSIYTAMVFVFVCLGIIVIGKWLIKRVDSQNERITSLEASGIETNVIVKKIDQTMREVLSDAQKTNVKVIDYLIKKDERESRSD